MRRLEFSAAFNPTSLSQEDRDKAARIRKGACIFAHALSEILTDGAELEFIIQRIEDVSMRAVKTLSEQARERYNGA